MKVGKKLTNKNGISLIVLVITIIVIIILAVAVILSISNNNPINNAKRAVNDWNDATVEEQINLLLLDYQLSEKSMGDFLRERAASGDIGLEEGNSSYIIELGDKKAGINKENNKVIGITSKDIFDEVKKMKEEFESSKSSITKNLINNSDEIKTYIPSYDTNKYIFNITQKANLLYVENDVMTEERKTACEMNDIYLLGDLNRNYELDEEDYEILSKNTMIVFKGREEIVADVNGDTIINNVDRTVLGNLLTDKYTPYVQKVKAEFDTNIAKEGSNRANITSTDINILRKYMPSHVDSKYDFGIQKGELVCLPFKSTGDIKVGICYGEGIYLLGDINSDCKVNNSDVRHLKNYIAGTYQPVEGEDTPVDIVGDINADGVVDQTDVDLLQDMINKNK